MFHRGDGLPLLTRFPSLPWGAFGAAVLPKRLLNLRDIGELIENTGVDEPMDVDFEC